MAEDSFQAHIKNGNLIATSSNGLAHNELTQSYDPVTGRFISEDPAFDGLNWYVYCGNNPISNIDPTGLAFLSKREANKFVDTALFYYNAYNKNGEYGQSREEVVIKTKDDDEGMVKRVRYTKFSEWYNNTYLYPKMTKARVEREKRKKGNHFYTGWCAKFVSYCAWEAGIDEETKVPHLGASTRKSYDGRGSFRIWYWKRSRWKGKDYMAKKGDLIFKANGSHVGIVAEDRKNTYPKVKVVEGNPLRYREWEPSWIRNFGQNRE